jgi:hypothetical protein
MPPEPDVTDHRHQVDGTDRRIRIPLGREHIAQILRKLAKPANNVILDH